MRHFLAFSIWAVNFIWWKLDSTAPFLDSSYWKLLLDLSNKGAIEFNSHYIKFSSRKKESLKCPTAMRASGIPRNDLEHAIDKFFTFHWIKHPIEFDYSLAGRALRSSTTCLWFRIDVGPQPKYFCQQIVKEWIECTFLEHFNRAIHLIPYSDAYYMDRTILYSQWQDSLTNGLIILTLTSRLLRIRRACYYFYNLEIIIFKLEIS